MPDIFQMIQTEYRLPASDFPNLDRFCQVVANMDFSTFPSLNLNYLMLLMKSYPTIFPRL